MHGGAARYQREWIEQYVRPGVRIKTYERYQCSINNHIIPYIGEIAIDRLTAEDVQKMINELLESGGEYHQGLSARTVNTARRTLKTALDKAYHLRKISYNPVEATKSCRTEKAQIIVLSHEQAQTLLQVAKGENQAAYMAILLALSTGMRLGEIFGLLWENIDIPAKMLYVKQTLVYSDYAGYLLPRHQRLTADGSQQIG